MINPRPAPEAPRLFEAALAPLRRARALALAEKTGQIPDFLLVRAADELAERLGAVRRDFPLALDLATPLAHFSDVLRRTPRAGAVESAADAEAQPLRDAAFSLIVSGLALHLVNDLPGAFARIRRALKPDGLFLACLPAGRTLEELRLSLALAEEELRGGVSPRIIPFADLRDLGSLLQRAGFALPVVDADTVTVRYADMFALMRDLRAMGAANPLHERSRVPATRALFLRAAQIYAEKFSDLDGRIRATFEIVWLSGWAPHESQQKPLKPGSAQMRLADALGADRTPPHA